MPNGFNIGRDVSMDIVDPVRGLVRVPLKTGATFTPVYDSLQSKALDGIPRHDEIPNGHRIAVEVDRKDATLDDYFTAREADYFNGLPVPNVSFTETITEQNGGVSVFRYTDVAIKLTNGGTWRGNTITTQAFEGMASRKIKIQ
jgi:hypothetical protein